MLDLTRFYLLVFGVITIAGGVMGFVKAKSRPSLIAGSISGAALLIAGYLASTATTVRIGLVVGLVVSLALGGRFVGAFRKSKKMMPAGLMAALGVVGVVLTVLALVMP
ncbi:MAG: TMEM14 family protein [Polyangiaceae bacterium]